MESRISRHEPLYLKHRPQSLAELVGQESVSRTLSNAITYGRLTHAYLFTGPRGTGKTSSARILAKSLNCLSTQSATLTPCQVCDPCREIKAGISPAVMEIDAASNNSVDDARLLIERAPLKAVGGRYKVYIIDECHMLTKEAFNALLKTIEQPPPDVVFILATTEEHKVLPTIISRCQRLMFRNVEQETLAAHLKRIADLEKIEIEDEALRVIARRSGGGLRDALSALDQASLLAAPGAPVKVSDLLRLLGALHEDVLLQISESILQRDGRQLLQSVSSLLAEGREPAVLAKELAAHFLNIAKVSYMANATDTTAADVKSIVLGSEQYIAELIKQAPSFEQSEICQIIEALDRLEATCKRTTQPTMHLEAGLLSICNRHDMLLLKELSRRVAQLEQAVQTGRLSGIDERPQHQGSAVQAVNKNTSVSLNASANNPLDSRQANQQGASTTSSTTAPATQAPEVPAVRTDDRDASIPLPAQEQSDSGMKMLPPDTTAPTRATSPPADSKPVAAIDIGHEDRTGNPTATGSTDVEETWSRILAELHRINIPTHGFFNSRMAFVLDMTQSDITIGVKTAGFQKTLESKVNHIKAACKAVTGREPNVKVKVAADAKPLSGTVSSALRTAAPAQASGETRPASEQPDSPIAAAALSRTSDTTSSGSILDEGRPAAEFDNSAVKEAYKLFEGPGSRRIGN